MVVKPWSSRVRSTGTARSAAAAEELSRERVRSGSMATWVWQSMNPGVRVCPVRSIRSVPGGGVSPAPTARTRPSSTQTSSTPAGASASPSQTDAPLISIAAMTPG